MSPEQIEGVEPDARADLYALGVVLFEMLTGQPPFNGPTDMSTAIQHLNVVPPDVRTLQPSTPPAFADLIRKLLAKRPDDRPSSAVAVRQILAGIESGVTGDAIAGPVGADPTIQHAAVGIPPAPTIRQPSVGVPPCTDAPATGPDGHRHLSPAPPAPDLEHRERIDQDGPDHSIPRARPVRTARPPAPAGQLAGPGGRFARRRGRHRGDRGVRRRQPERAPHHQTRRRRPPNWCPSPSPT